MKKDHAITAYPWQQVKPILMQALEVSGNERDILLHKACEGNESLRLAVEQYLEANPETDFFDAHIQWMAQKVDGSFEQTRIGPYLLEEKLGLGGMGAVYLASRDDKVFEKKVAIKILKHEIRDTAWGEHFHKERQILAELTHPNIVQLFDGGTTSTGLPYFVMEYVEGMDLKSYCKQNDIPLEARLELLQKVCQAVHFAHQHLIIHGDIKPNNILVTHLGEVKLLDFGIADWAYADQKSSFGSLQRPMTPQYASPEQKRFGPLSTSSDIYALGVLGYELLTGELPGSENGMCLKPSHAVLGNWEGKNRPKPSTVYLKAITNTQNLALSKKLRGDLDHILLKALAHEPSDRYASAKALAEDIDRYFQGFPISARKWTKLYGFQKVFQRHRLAVSAALTGALAVVFCLIMIFFQNQHILEERSRATRENDLRKVVKNFLVDVLTEANPYESVSLMGDKHSSGTFTTKGLLDNASQKITEEHYPDPLTQAAIMTAIGGIYSDLEFTEEASALLSPALAVYQQHYPKHHPEMLKAQMRQAKLALRRSRHEEAGKLFRKVEQAYQIHHLPTDITLCETWTGLAYSLHVRGEFEAAAALFHRVLKSPVAQPKQRAHAHNGLGRVHYKKESFEAAIQHYQTAMGLYEAERLMHHPLYANTIENLGILYRTNKKLIEAKALFEKSAAIREVHFNTEHPNLAASYNNLGLVNDYLGNPQKAEAYYLKATHIREKFFGSFHVEVANSYNNLANFFRSQQKYEQAENFHLKALGVRRELFGEKGTYTLATYHNMGNLYFEMGEFQVALNLQKTLSEAFGEKFGPQHRYVAFSLLALGKTYRALGQELVAQGLADQALAIELGKGKDSLFAPEITEFLNDLCRN